MKRLVISYGDSKYSKSLDLLEKTSIEIGKADEFKRYTREWLETTEFHQKNKYVLSGERGNGWWAWKPYIILDSLESMEDGEVLIYSDAGLEVIDDLTPLFEIGESNDSGRMIFKLPWVGAKHIAKIWTKRDCFVLMKCDEEKYWNAPMTNGAVSLWKKSPENIEFLKEWQRYLLDPRIVTDDANFAGKPNFMEFKDHRHDQSVLTMLATKYDIELYRDPTQYGNEEIMENSTYTQLFHHHRNFKH